MLFRKKLIQLQIAIAVLICFQLKSTLTLTSHNEIKVSSSLRLPNTTIPENYFLQITTYIHKDIREFDGTVSIIISILRNTEEIVLHARRLLDFQVNLTEYVPQTQKHENLKYSHDNETSFLRIFSPIELQAGQRYQLEISFVGSIQDEHFGFYKTTYVDDQNNTIPLAATQFETTSARMAFPCFDEPSFKANFVVSITHGNNYSALSNMPVKGEPEKSQNDEMTTTKFHETPLMSTYLLAFVVSNYEHISQTVNGIQHRVFFPPKSNNQEEKVIENAITSLTALENYLGIRYVLPKLDYVRLDKTYGLAMENWGLITYNNDVSLSAVDGDPNSDEDIIKNTIIQNHEIAHQWFGNLVSPKWWTYAWLNEGFAMYFGYLLTELIHPNWNITELFIQKEVNFITSWSVSHPITQYVERDGEIKSNFDVVCYQKSSSVIKMFHHAIGLDIFIKGISGYLEKFKFSVAEEDDLFEALQAAIDTDQNNVFKSPSDISNVFRSWTHNLGIPMIKVVRNYDTGTISFYQKSTSDGHLEKFWIPVNLATAYYPNFEQTKADLVLQPFEVFTINPMDLELNISNNEWLILNKQQTGFYFVAYDDRNLDLIANALNTNHHQIHKLNRALLFRDIDQFLNKDTEMVKSMNIDPVLSIIRYLKHEQDLMPWNAASNLILNLINKLDRSYTVETFEMFKSFIRGIIDKMFQELMFNWLPISDIDITLRSKILELGCKVDLPECRTLVKNLTEEYFFNEQPMEDLARDIILCQGIRDFRVEDLEKVFAKVSTKNINSEFYDDVVYAVRCIEHPESMSYILEFFFSENSTLDSAVTKAHYLTFWFSSNHILRPVIADFLCKNYNRLLSTPKAEEHLLTRMSSYIPENGYLKEKYDELFKKITGHFPNATKHENLKIGSRIRHYNLFVNTHEQKIKKWLISYEQDYSVLKSSAYSGTKPMLKVFAVKYTIAVSLLINYISLRFFC